MQVKKTAVTITVLLNYISIVKKHKNVSMFDLS